MRRCTRGTVQTLCHLSKGLERQEVVIVTTVWRVSTKAFFLLLKAFYGKEELTTLLAADSSPQTKHRITTVAKFDCPSESLGVVA